MLGFVLNKNITNYQSQQYRSFTYLKFFSVDKMLDEMKIKIKTRVLIKPK